MPSYPLWASRFELKPGKWVFVPSKESVIFGRKVKRLVESRWSPPDYYYHLKSGGHVKALHSHTCGRYFVHLDLKHFFGSINRSRITRTLKSRVSYDNARLIANHSAVKDPDSNGQSYILPYGFIQSPALASICLYCSKLGKVLHELSRRKGIVVSVYVDDIIISTRSLGDAQSALDRVKAAAERSRFPLNAEKEEGPSDKITAFNIELSHSALLIEPERLNQFIDAYRNAADAYQQEGILGYIQTVNAQQGALLCEPANQSAMCLTSHPAKCGDSILQLFQPGDQVPGERKSV